MAIDWETAAKGLGGAAALIGAAVQLSRLRGSLTASLRADLDLLDRLKNLDDQESYLVLKRSVDARIHRKYAPRAAERGSLGIPRVTHMGDLVFGSLVLVVFSLWAAYLVRNGFRWWALIPAFFALGGVGGIMQGFEKEPALGKDEGKRTESGHASEAT